MSLFFDIRDAVIVECRKHEARYHQRPHLTIYINKDLRQPLEHEMGLYDRRRAGATANQENSFMGHLVVWSETEKHFSIVNQVDMPARGNHGAQ